MRFLGFVGSVAILFVTMIGAGLAALQGMLWLIPQGAWPFASLGIGIALTFAGVYGFGLVMAYWL